MIQRRSLLALSFGAASVAVFPQGLLAQPGPGIPRLALIDAGLSVEQTIAAGLTGDPIVPRDELTGRQYSFRLFFEDLLRLGYAEGVSIIVDRWSVVGISAEGRAAIVGQILASRPDIIVAGGDQWVPQLTAAITTIPIVVRVTDPVELGIVANLARPEGNVTGVMTRPAGPVAYEGRLIQLLLEIAPTVQRVAWIGVQRDLTNPTLAADRADLIAAFAARGVAVALVVTDPPSLARADVEAWLRRLVSGLVAQGFDGVLVQDSPEFRQPGDDFLPGLLLEARLPLVTNVREFVREGALLQYGMVTDPLYVEMARYVDRILRGVAAADLPFQGPTDWELIINKRTADALGLTIPTTLLATAAEVVE